MLIIFSDKKQEIDTTQKMHEALADDGPGYCVIRNQVMDADEFMQWIQKQTGNSFTTSTGKTPYDIVQDTQQPETILSRTAHDFPLHTDCAYLDRPADIVTLYCVEQSATGGENTILNIRDIIPLLDESLSAVLFTKEFCFGSSPQSILEQDGQTCTVRFSMFELEHCTPVEQLSVVREKLSRWNALLNNRSLHTVVRLEPGDCLLVNNRTTLHGRYAFEKGSGRLVYRMRQYL